MFYVITESTMQIDESPFATREAAEEWVTAHSGGGFRYYILTETEMDEMERSADYSHVAQ